MSDDSTNEMSDGRHDERIDLLSAYLDGQVTDEERARVVADPEALGAVADLRQVRAALARVDPPSDAARERAIVAALHVSDVTDPAPVVALRRRSPRVLTVAAAVLTLAVLGAVVVVGSRDRGGGDGRIAGDAPMEAAVEEDAPAELFAMDDADADADAMERSAVPGGPLPDGAPDTETFDADAFEHDRAVAATATDEVLPHVGPVEADALAATVAALLAESGTDHGADAYSCPDEVVPVVGTGEHLGIAVLLGPDPSGTVARAVDPADCSVLLEAPLRSD